MKNEAITEETPELDEEPTKKIEWEKAYQEARTLHDQIFTELERIDTLPGGEALYDQKLDEVQNPQHWDRATLEKCAVYHAIIGSSRTYEDKPQIDLPGPDNLMSFYTKKLAELKEIH